MERGSIFRVRGEVGGFFYDTEEARPFLWLLRQPARTLTDALQSLGYSPANKNGQSESVIFRGGDNYTWTDPKGRYSGVPNDVLSVVCGQFTGARLDTDVSAAVKARESALKHRQRRNIGIDVGRIVADVCEGVIDERRGVLKVSFIGSPSEENQEILSKCGFTRELSAGSEMHVWTICDSFANRLICEAISKRAASEVEISSVRN
jgi:hypothetical protein